MTLVSGKTISGLGSVNGDFVVGTSATLSPGSLPLAASIGTLTFSNSPLTLAAGVRRIFLGSPKVPSTNDAAKSSGAY